MVKVKQESTFTLPKAGSHVAVVVGIFDVGYHFNERYQKKEHKGYIVFEIDEQDSSGKHIELSKSFTFNLGEKANLRKLVNAALGRDVTAQEQATGFETDDLIGKAVQISVSHYTFGDRTNAGIETIISLMTGIKAFKPDKLYTTGTPEPKWILEKRSKSIEAKLPEGVDGEDDEEGIPWK